MSGSPSWSNRLAALLTERLQRHGLTAPVVAGAVAVALLHAPTRPLEPERPQPTPGPAVPLLTMGFDHQLSLIGALGPSPTVPPWVTAETRAAWERDIAPVRRAVARYRHDPYLVEEVASAMVLEARRVGVDPMLGLGILATENRRLEPNARSMVGAVGLMQVMPFHAGQFACDGTDLTRVRTNICHGLQIFRQALRRTKGNVRQALLRYNGCVRSTNTPNCHQYPEQVLTRTTLARRDGARRPPSLLRAQARI